VSLYQQLADEIAASVRNGSWTTGERMPSVRQLSRERGVSAATVIHAYEQLEEQGFIESMPRSGYYVSAYWRERPPETTTNYPRSGATRLEADELVFEVLDAVRNPNIVPFGSAFPSPDMFPLRMLARSVNLNARRSDPWRSVKDLGWGSWELRRQIARRYLRHGAHVSAEEIVITTGAMEALNLSLQTLARPGDAVAIESPTFYGCLQAIEALGLHAVEIPTNPRYGIELDALDKVLQQNTVRVCWLMTTFQNPTGACMSDASKRELVRLLEKYDVPLIEDNVYAEMYFGSDRPTLTKAFDRRGLVLDCGSFSKCLAPGYRVGWVAAGRFALSVERRKLMSTLVTSVPMQDAIATFVRRAAYDRHLRGLRRALANQQTAMLRSLERNLAGRFSVTRPNGGYFLWIEMPSGVDSVALHRLALSQGFCIAPGPMFSARREFKNCIRLNYGHPWSTRQERAMHDLADMVTMAVPGHVSRTEAVDSSSASNLSTPT
jgi:DNA-binding transcriptional MocR family regulator